MVERRQLLARRVYKNVGAGWKCDLLGRRSDHRLRLLRRRYLCVCGRVGFAGGRFYTYRMIADRCLYSKQLF